MSTFREGLALQGRVLWALALREIHGRHGKSRLGYLWQIIRTGSGIAIFWVIRSFIGFNAPGGIPMPLFLMFGFITFYLFQECVNKTMEAVSTNSSLLTFPQIQPLDLFLSSALVVFVNDVIVMTIFLVGWKFWGFDFSIYDPLTLCLGLVGVWAFGFGVGLICGALTYYFPVVEKIVPMVMRVMFLTSGVFFSPAQLAAKLGDVIWLNPLANYIELLRGTMLSRSPVEAVRLEYILYLTVIALALGLLFERHVRAKEQMP